MKGCRNVGGENSISLCNRLGFPINNRLIEGVFSNRDEAGSRFEQHLGIRVKGNDVFRFLQCVQVSNKGLERVFLPFDHPNELGDGPAFALPP